MPIRLEIDANWRATDWLGIVTAGMLWTSVCLTDNFEGSVAKVVQQIQSVAQLDFDDSGGGSAASADTGEEKTEMVSELHRLRTDMAAAARVGSTQWADEGDAQWKDQPARLHSIIPELPNDFRLTNDIETLTQLVLGQGKTHKRAVGFYGMGGIGKTVTGAAVCRAAGVRSWFDRIVWVTLGQSPIIPKVQSLAYMQLTGSDLKDSLTIPEKEEALRKAMESDRILLVLDDLWNENDEDHINFLPEEDNGSRVLISTRVRGLLRSDRPGGVNAIEVGLPDIQEAIRIVMNAAEVPSSSRAPPEAREVVDICGRLPLALR